MSGDFFARSRVAEPPFSVDIVELNRISVPRHGRLSRRSVSTLLAEIESPSPDMFVSGDFLWWFHPHAPARGNDFRNLNRRPEPTGSLLVSVDSSASLHPPPAALRLRPPLTPLFWMLQLPFLHNFPMRLVWNNMNLCENGHLGKTSIQCRAGACSRRLACKYICLSLPPTSPLSQPSPTIIHPPPPKLSVRRSVFFSCGEKRNLHQPSGERMHSLLRLVR